MVRLLTFFIIVLFIGCKKDTDYNYYNYCWVGEFRKHADTIFFHQKTTFKNDSFILECEGKEDHNIKKPLSFLFIFNLKDKTKAFYSGAVGNKMVFKYLNDTTICRKQHSYRVYKYLENEEDAYDAATNYFWCPEIGIVYISNVKGAERRLFTNNAKSDSTIGLIINAVHDW